MTSKNVPVEFNGEKYIWLRNEDGSGPLAYPEHIDENGDVHLYDALCSDSFAYIGRDGLIRRYRKTIGTCDDLKIVKKD